MTRVVHVIAPAPFGGAESVVRALAEGAVATGRDASVALLCENDRPSPLASSLLAAGVRVDEIRAGRRAYFAETRALVTAMQARDRQLVHTHIYHADAVGWLAARRANVPVIGTLHGHTAGSLGNRTYEFLDRQLLRVFNAVVCVSEDARNKLLRAGCRPERLHVVRNGFAPRAFLDRTAARAALGVPLDAPVVGWIGRLSIEKGADLFVDALAALRHPTASGLLIGDGEERADIERRIVSQFVSARCIGARADAASLMKAFDVVVLSSRTEGTPMVLLEAMAAGVPIVTFAVGGVPAVVNQDSAWLVPTGDAVALGSAIGDALALPDEVVRRSARAAQVLERDFGRDAWLSELDRVYESVLRGR